MVHCWASTGGARPPFARIFLRHTAGAKIARKRRPSAPNDIGGCFGGVLNILKARGRRLLVMLLFSNFYEKCAKERLLCSRSITHGVSE